MNKFTDLEERAALITLEDAQYHTKRYAQPEDREAATIALLLRALDLAGGHQHIKPQGDQN